MGKDGGGGGCNVSMHEAKFGRRVASVEHLADYCKDCAYDATTLQKILLCNVCKSEQSDEVIEYPKHYNKSTIQPIDAIEAWELDFRLANAVKYIARHKHKGKAKEDLQKAVWYINRYIDKELGEDNGES